MSDAECWEWLRAHYQLAVTASCDGVRWYVFNAIDGSFVKEFFGDTPCEAIRAAELAWRTEAIDTQGRLSRA